jgi:predicted RNA-binding Zn-ribbon protein involved in translation (DUF1610 family)
MKNRKLNRIYARLNNYFWLPCPLCGQEFGGHECVVGNEYYALYDQSPEERNRTGFATGKVICPDCGDKREAEALKAAN